MSLIIHTERTGTRWAAAANGGEITADGPTEGRAVRALADVLRLDYEPRDSIDDAIRDWRQRTGRDA